MGIIDGLVLIFLGALCIPSLIAKKSPAAKDLLDKIAPVQGWIGIIAAFWGVWGIISAILTISWLRISPLGWFTGLIGSLLCILIGFILGYGLIQEYTLKKASEEVKAKAEQAKEKLVAKQSLLGFVALGFGLWVIIHSLFFRSVYYLL